MGRRLRHCRRSRAKKEGSGGVGEGDAVGEVVGDCLTGDEVAPNQAGQADGYDAEAEDVAADLRGWREASRDGSQVLAMWWATIGAAFGPRDATFCAAGAVDVGGASGKHKPGPARTASGFRGRRGASRGRERRSGVQPMREEAPIYLEARTRWEASPAGDGGVFEAASSAEVEAMNGLSARCLRKPAQRNQLFAQRVTSWSLIALMLFGWMPRAQADAMPVRYVQGSFHGFLELRSEGGNVVASGDSLQFVHGDRITAETIFRFKDGSVDDETTVYTQHKTFHLISDRHVQRGPSFPHPLDVLIDAASGM